MRSLTQDQKKLRNLVDMMHWSWKQGIKVIMYVFISFVMNVGNDTIALVATSRGMHVLLIYGPT